MIDKKPGSVFAYLHNLAHQSEAGKELALALIANRAFVRTIYTRRPLNEQKKER